MIVTRKKTRSSEIAINLAFAVKGESVDRDYQLGVDLLLETLRALGWQGDMRDVFEAMPHATEHFGAAEMRETFLRLGIQTRSISRKQALSDRAPRPVLMAGRDGELAVRIEDGPEGLCFVGNLSPGQAAACFVFAGTGESDADMTHANLLRRILDSNWRDVFALLATQVMLTFVTLALSMKTILIYGYVLPTSAKDTLAALVIGALIVVAIDLAIHRKAARMVGDMARRVELRLSRIILDQLLALPYARTGVVDAMTQAREIRDLERARDAISGPVTIAVLQGPFVLVFLIVIWAVAGPLVLAPLLGVASGIVIGWVSIVRLRVREAVAADREAAFLAAASEAAEAADLIRVSGCDALFAENLRMLAIGTIAARETAARIQLVGRSLFRLSITLTGGATMVMAKAQFAVLFGERFTKAMA